MQIQLIGSNVAIVANQFNPSIFSQYWLIRNEIVSDNELWQGCIQTDDLAKIECKQFGLLVLPPQLQFVPKADTPQAEQSLIADVLGAIVRLLPHTPYGAIGFNFRWHVIPGQDDNAPGISRRLFYKADSPVSVAVGDVEDLGIGAYYSRSMPFGGRMRLDIKPLQNDHLQFAFNFQAELGKENAVEEIESYLNHWQTARLETSRITESVMKG